MGCDTPAPEETRHGDIDVVRGVLDAYRAQDHVAAERLIAGDLVFTSPQDDHIDRDTWFDRCFPTASVITGQQVRFLADLDADHVLLAYDYDATTGGGSR